MALKSARAKGKQGELEACHTLRDMFGWHANRTQQRTGWSKNGDSPDIEVEETPTLFYEIKRVQALNVPRALSLAVRQAGRRCPVVMHRPNRSPNGWMITIRLADLPRLCHAFQHAIDSETSSGSALASAPLSDAHSSHSKAGAVNPRSSRDGDYW